MKIEVLTRYIILYTLFLILHQGNILLSQSEILGNPYIENFSKEIYAGGTQNWDSGIMASGHILIANDDGLLKFNGVDWTSHPLPNKTIVRSICITENRIYIGGQDEIGYLSVANNGTLTFQSIRHLIPEMFLPLQDVWQLKLHKNKIYLRSLDRIYIFDPEKNQFEVIDPKSPITSLIQTDDQIYYANVFKGLVSLSDTSKMFPDSDLLKFVPIIDVIAEDTDPIFITERFGSFKIKDQALVPANTKTHEYLIEKGVFCTTTLSNGNIAIGTQFGGLIIVDKDGKTLRKIDNQDGLTNNNVHSISQDKNGDLWIGTSNGINRIALEKSLQKVPSNSILDGTFYAVKAHNGKLFFGSNNALYCTDLSSQPNNYSENTYRKLKYSEGQVWGLNTIDGDLLMGHNTGAYLVHDEYVELISPEPGAWKFIPARNNKEMYVGTYNGVSIYKKKDGKWTFFKKLEGFVESSRIIISVRQNEIWVSHPYRGVYKIEHDDDYFVNRVTLYDERNGLPSILANYIFNVDGIPYVTAETGIYYYDRVHDKFLKDAEINNLIDSTKNVRRLFQEKEGKIWFLAEHEAGYLEKNREGKYEKVLYPSLVNKYVNGFEEMYFFTENQALICGIDDMLCLDLNHKMESPKPITYITKTQLITHPDSLLFGGNSSSETAFSNTQSENQIPELNYDQNEVVFSYCSPSHSEGILYSFALVKGQNPDNEEELEWSNWSSQTTKEYNNLSSGDYIYIVRAMSQNGIIGDSASYSFSINPPWYYSKVAIGLYWLLAFIGLAALIFIPRTKFKKEKEILTTAKEESEAQLEAIKTEKLKAEIDFKNTELASSTMHLVQKNETINRIRQEIQSVSKKIKDTEAKKEIRKILSLFSDDERLEDEWENFSRHFDKVHTNFLKRITSEHPQLTPKDKKLCAYLRMNLSTKEIAPLLNIPVRGVEISRYRLRKKLEIDGSVNLNEFMMNF